MRQFHDRFFVCFIVSNFFLEKEDDPRPLHLDDAYGHFINYSHKTLQSDTTVRLKPLSKQQTIATPIQLMKGADSLGLIPNRHRSQA